MAELRRRRPARARSAIRGARAPPRPQRGLGEASAARLRERIDAAAGPSLVFLQKPSFFEDLLPDFLAPASVLHARWKRTDEAVAAAQASFDARRAETAALEADLAQSADEIQVQRLMTFHRGWQQDLDAFYRWGLQWGAGSK